MVEQREASKPITGQRYKMKFQKLEGCVGVSWVKRLEEGFWADKAACLRNRHRKYHMRFRRGSVELKKGLREWF